RARVFQTNAVPGFASVQRLPDAVALRVVSANASFGRPHVTDVRFGDWSCVEDSDAADVFFWAASDFRMRSCCWEKVMVDENRTSKASDVTHTFWIMNFNGPGEEFVVPNGNARDVKRTDGRASAWARGFSRPYGT